MTAITADSLGRAAIRLPAAVFWPALLLAAAWGAMLFSSHIPSAIGALLPYLPYGLGLVGAIIGWRFNRSRLVFSMAMLVTGHWLLLGPASNIKPGSADEIGYILYAFLFPIGFVALSLLHERGLLSRLGLVRALGFAAVGGAAVAIAAAHLWLVKDVTADLHGWVKLILSLQLVPQVYLPQTAIPAVALVVFGAAAVFFVLRLVALGNPPLESGALGALVAAGLALHFAGNATAGSVFFTTAATTLLIAAIQDTYRLAFHDELTGLPGRRALMNETMKLGPRYAIAMLDIDHFKKFNDTYGHDVGDQVLRMVASRMERVGGGGKPFRYGGEEFTVVFSGKTSTEAVEHLDSLRQNIKESGFTIRSKDRKKKSADNRSNGKTRNGRKVSVTISIGVAERTDQNPSPDTVIKAADQALYRAKKNGRNRVST
ncbi:MAG: GGDEF domain-containing protein [Alphaproteobacteria bacterium]|nr:GGDEF domain-containing protein [Alphaproteobacteria bacterium]